MIEASASIENENLEWFCYLSGFHFYTISTLNLGKKKKAISADQSDECIVCMCRVSMPH